MSELEMSRIRNELSVLNSKVYTFLGPLRKGVRMVVKGTKFKLFCCQRNATNEESREGIQSNYIGRLT